MQCYDNHFANEKGQGLSQDSEVKINSEDGFEHASSKRNVADGGVEDRRATLGASRQGEDGGAVATT